MTLKVVDMAITDSAKPRMIYFAIVDIYIHASNMADLLVIQLMFLDTYRLTVILVQPKWLYFTINCRPPKIYIYNHRDQKIYSGM